MMYRGGDPRFAYEFLGLIDEGWEKDFLPTGYGCFIQTGSKDILRIHRKNNLSRRKSCQDTLSTS